MKCLGLFCEVGGKGGDWMFFCCGASHNTDSSGLNRKSQKTLNRHQNTGLDSCNQFYGMPVVDALLYLLLNKQNARSSVVILG